MRYAVIEAEKITGRMKQPELIWLAKLASQQSPYTTWVEVGSWFGRSLLATGLSLPYRSRLFAVDNFSWNNMVTEAREGLAAIVSRLNNTGVPTTHINQLSTEAAKTFPNGSCDVVFIDGNHQYHAVVSDIQAWLPKLHPGGVLCGHDMNHESVSRAVNELLDEYEVHGVIWSYVK